MTKTTASYNNRHTYNDEIFEERLRRYAGMRIHLRRAPDPRNLGASVDHFMDASCSLEAAVALANGLEPVAIRFGFRQGIVGLVAETPEEKLQLMNFVGSTPLILTNAKGALVKILAQPSERYSRLLGNDHPDYQEYAAKVDSGGYYRKRVRVSKYQDVLLQTDFGSKIQGGGRVHTPDPGVTLGLLAEGDWIPVNGTEGFFEMEPGFVGEIPICHDEWLRRVRAGF